MKVQNIQQHYSQNFKSETEPAKKEKFTDKFSSRIKNSADLNDCVAVPRTIFKEYLSFMLGTALTGLAGFLPERMHKLKVAGLIAGNLINTYGVWAFVRPYVLKDGAPTVKGTAKLDEQA